MKNGEPFNYRNFGLAVDCLISYSHLVLKEGPLWLGCRFCNPIAWHPAPNYKVVYELPKGETEHVFEGLVALHGFRPMDDKPYSAYSLPTLHVNYSFHEGMKNIK